MPQFSAYISWKYSYIVYLLVKIHCKERDYAGLRYHQHHKMGFQVVKGNPLFEGSL